MSQQTGEEKPLSTKVRGLEGRAEQKQKTRAAAAARREAAATALDKAKLKLDKALEE